MGDTMVLLVGQMLYGYCGGYFGDEYGDKRIEAVGADWIVARSFDGVGFRAPLFASDPEIHAKLAEFTKPERKE